MPALTRNKNQNSCIYGQEDFCVITLLGSYVSFVKDNALSAGVPDCLYPTCTTPGLCMSSNELLKTERVRMLHLPQSKAHINSSKGFSPF